MSNYQVYGDYYPPRIPIEDITLPMVLVAGEDDKLATAMDAIDVANQMEKAEVDVHVVKGADHLSLIAGKDLTYF